MSLLRRKLVRDLLRQRTQSIAIAVTIFLGALLAVLSGGAYRDLEASYQRVFDVTRFPDLWARGGQAAPLAAMLAHQPGVAAALARRAIDVPADVGGRHLLARAVEVPPGANIATLLVTGKPLDPARPGDVLVEGHFAGHDHLAPGSHLALFVGDSWRDLTVRGVAASAEYIWPARSRQDLLPPPGTFGVVFVSPALAAELLPDPNEVLIRFAPGATAAQRQAVRALAARYGAAVMTRAEQPSNAALSSDIDGFKEMALMFPALFLIAAALATAVLLARRVRTERTVIGTLRACGVAPSQIVRHYLGYGVVLGLAGAVPGALAGQLASRAVTTQYTKAIDVPITVTQFHPWFFVLAIAFGVLAGVIAAIAPARAAAAVAPAEAMRGIAPEGGRRLRPWLERLFPKMPARWKLILRNLSRNRRRTLSTVLGVVLAATLVLVSWGMIDSTRATLHLQFDVIEHRDATLYLAGTTDASTVVAAARRVPGVAAAEPMLELPVTVDGPRGSYPGALAALPADTTMHRFLEDGHAQHLGKGVLVGRALGKRLGLTPGATAVITVEGHRLGARVDGFVDEVVGSYTYAALDTAEALGATPNSVAVRFAPGAPRAALLARLGTLPGVAVVIDARALLAAAQQYMGLMYTFVGIMLVLGSALAFAILLVTMSVNIAERTTELATLRAAGVSHRQLARLVTAENLLVTAIGVVPGIAVGLWVSSAFLGSFTSDLFRMQMAVPWTTPAGTALALLVTALISQRPGLRAIRRLDLAKVVRERSA